MEGHPYNSIEQYLAHTRSRIMGRRHLEEQAVTLTDPGEAKRILNILREEPHQGRWEEQRQQVLRRGLFAKFSQCEDLKEYLLSSGKRILGEASLNRVWGIGLTLTNRAKLNPKQWRGDNLQGRTLMEVREQLVAPTTTTTTSQPTTSSSLLPQTSDVNPVHESVQPGTNN